MQCRRCKKDAVPQEVQESKKERKGSKLVMMYPFGAGLVQFMEERKFISLASNLKDPVRVNNVMKKKGAYYLPRHLYAVCNFDLSLPLPIKLNLLMVCQPLDWTSACPPGQEPRTVSDLRGSYVSGGII